MITTTLKALRELDICTDRYNKLACHVTNNEYDSNIEVYVSYEYDKPISLLTALQSIGLREAVWALQTCEQTPELIQAARLYAVWCARQVQHYMTDERSIAALDVAERHAYGLATDEELSVARDTAREASIEVIWDVIFDTSRAVAYSVTKDVVWSAVYSAVIDSAYATDSVSAYEALEVIQKQMFIEVFCGESINIDPLKKK